jgi:tetratricopeptide (TPR) repeat protein
MFQRLVLALAFCLALGSHPLRAADAKSIYVQANVAYGQRNYPQAFQLYRQVCVLDPSSAPGWWGLANALYMLGRKPESLEAYRQTAKLMPQSAAVLARVRQVDAELHPAAQAPAPSPAPAAAAAPAPARQAQGDWYSALWRSALVPGWGQAYNGQTNKAWLLGGLTWVSFGGVVATYEMGSQAEAQYHAATTPSDAVDKYNAAYNDYVANQTFYIVFGLAYTYNLVDAALNAGSHQDLAQAPSLGGVQLALAPGAVLLHKEWTW